MHTRHLSNQPFTFGPVTNKALAALAGCCGIVVIIIAPSSPKLALVLTVLLLLAMYIYILIVRSRVSYTLTATHFQQHLYKGGWVVKWTNISQIGICQYDQDGWQTPLPWIGIKLKHYSPYLDGICPRVAAEILLGQRALLYLGAKQLGQEAQFENIVFDARPYSGSQGKIYEGLLAILANRMTYQRRFYGYDIFIAVRDLDRSAEEFVGLARRYLAAAEPEPKQIDDQ
ncbi:DUF2982 domain-containing protein [Vibrio sp.]|uniref:DUF2982 domain-containing protein n=1 Tax=Vibrio sp. TaxID=678 RepID=UPI003D0F4503